MDTLVRPPMPPAGTATGGRRRWPSWARRLVIAAVVLLAGLAVFGAVWIANYQPLGPGSVTYGAAAGIGFEPPFSPRNVTEQRIDAFGVYGTVIRVPVDKGSTFTYTFTLRNDGPLSVEVLDVAEREFTATRRVVEVDRDLFEEGASRESFLPFEPFTLPPDTEAVFRVRVDVRRTMQRGTSVSWFQEPVTFSVLGVTRHAWVTSGLQIDLVSERG